MKLPENTGIIGNQRKPNKVKKSSKSSKKPRKHMNRFKVENTGSDQLLQTLKEIHVFLLKA